jgi:hypothetical protein
MKGHVACMGEMRNTYSVVGRDHSEDIGVDEKITLE